MEREREREREREERENIKALSYQTLLWNRKSVGCDVIWCLLPLKTPAKCLVGISIEEVCSKFSREKVTDHIRTFGDVLKIEKK